MEGQAQYGVRAGYQAIQDRFAFSLALFGPVLLALCLALAPALLFMWQKTPPSGFFGWVQAAGTVFLIGVGFLFSFLMLGGTRRCIEIDPLRRLIRHRNGPGFLWSSTVQELPRDAPVRLVPYEDALTVFVGPVEVRAFRGFSQADKVGNPFRVGLRAAAVLDVPLEMEGSLELSQQEQDDLASNDDGDFPSAERGLRNARLALVLGSLAIFCMGLTGPSAILGGLTARAELAAVGERRGAGMTYGAIVTGLLGIAFVVVGVLAHLKDW